MRFELDSETQDPTDVAEYQQRETNKLIEDGSREAQSPVNEGRLGPSPLQGHFNSDMDAC